MTGIINDLFKILENDATISKLLTFGKVYDKLRRSICMIEELLLDGVLVGR